MSAEPVAMFRDNPALRDSITDPDRPWETEPTPDLDAAYRCEVRHDDMPTHDDLGWVEQESVDTHGREGIHLVWVPFWEVRLPGREPVRLCEDCSGWVVELAATIEEAQHR